MIRPAFLSALLLTAATSCSRAEDHVKPAALAGSWYPADRAELSALLDRFFSQVKSTPKGVDIGAIVSPHAGLAFSGPVAAYGFKAAQARKVSTVVILAPSHHFSSAGASIWPDGAFLTPLGRVEVDAELAQKLTESDPRFGFRSDVFAGGPGQPENSVETQLPFIQKAFPGAKIVPIIVGFPADLDVLRSLARALAGALAGRDDVLVDVSVDQSHFHPETEARAIDARGLKAISEMDFDRFWAGHARGEMEVDGFHTVAAAMLYAQAAGYAKAKVLRHATSADLSGDRSRVVGYASIMFYRTHKPKDRGVAPLSPAQRSRLLTIARSTVEAFVKTGRAPEVAESDRRLNGEEGAFVTLQKHGRLRGCIGNILGRGPLYKTVRAMAVAAAAEDPRFSPVSADELKDIDIEISVLSKPRAVKSADEVVLGRHGVIVRRGFAGGVFLPQVATETKWSKERFLSELCAQKAGLPEDCWKDPGTTLEVFTAEVFGEKEAGPGR
ncbi:MAG: AmmeMemoRadiSam system protein B [Elusimicrobia bacterium]|nr:AmmeMemoRadiSam system protein B [Elusimicrobiota bacterium]